MAKLPAVTGLLKHQLYFLQPLTVHEQDVVMTLWTWKNEDPVNPARVAYEVGAIKAWAQGAAFRARTINQTQATWVKSWDMGSTPPSRFDPVRLWPFVSGSSSADYAPQLTAVIALRTQAVGSAVRNRQNGRVNHPFLINTDMTRGLLTGTAQALFVTAYHALRDVLKPAANALSGTWVVPCFFEDNALRPGGPLLPAVDHVICRPWPGVIRSRLVRPGPYGLGT